MDQVVGLKSDLWALMPYISLIAGAFFILCLSLLERKSKEHKSWYAFFGCFFSVLCLYFLFQGRGMVAPIAQGMLVSDHIAYVFSGVLLLLLIPASLAHAFDSDEIGDKPSGIVSLLLLSACGGLLMAHANHLLLFFVALELLSLPLYVITAIGKNPKASEAGFKYFLLGAFASAIFVYGVALTWSGFNTLWISEISQILEAGFLSDFSGSQWVGLALMFVGVLFKVGIFPFHAWIVDVYEAAPSHLVAWMSGAVKAATFVLALRLLALVPDEMKRHWMIVLTVFAVGSMLLGAVGGLFQKNIKRLLGYSTIAHGGYACIALLVVLRASVHEVVDVLALYLLVYGVSSMAAFTFAAVIEGAKQSIEVQGLKGFAQENAGLALVFSLSLLSLAGFPPLGGFFVKFQLFALSLRNGLLFVSIVAAISSVIALGYYLSILVAMYFKKGEWVHLYKSKVISIILFACVLLILAAGMMPSSIMGLMG